MIKDGSWVFINKVSLNRSSFQFYDLSMTMAMISNVTYIKFLVVCISVINTE